MKTRRLAQVTQVFTDEGLGFLLSALGKGESTAGAAGEAEAAAATDGEAAGGRAAELGVRLRRAFTRLGPTFVKFGQMLATRVDLFPEELLRELGGLHSNVEPFPGSEARRIFEEATGRRIGEVFAEFDPEPVASASIAQVHRATLAATGAKVAVKIQRPDVEASIAIDLEILLMVSKVLDLFVPSYRRSMIHRLAIEYAGRAGQELDFTLEGSAIATFSGLLRSNPAICVPRVVDELTTRRTLVTSWLDGVKLDLVPDAATMRRHGFDPREFARTLLDLQVRMAYEYGFVHGDTHPGNIFLLPDRRIGLIDFGLHAHIPDDVSNNMLEALLFQSQGRHREAAAAMVRVIRPADPAATEAFTADLAAFFAANSLDGGIASHRVSEQFVKSIRIGHRHQAQPESALFLVIRNLGIIEGLILRYCPDLNPVEELGTIIRGILRRRISPQNLLDNLGSILPEVALNIGRRQDLVRQLLRLERSFSEAGNLGDFLRREGVIETKPRRGPLGTPLGLLLLAVLTGWGLTLWGWLQAR